MPSPIATVLAFLLAVSGCHPQVRAVEWPSPDDAEFLYWCEAPEGERWPVYLEAPEPCEKVSRGQWDHLPVTVNAEDDLALEVMDAVGAWNEAVGFELFQYQQMNMRPDIAVIAAGEHLWAAAEAAHFTIDGKHSAAVLVYNELEKLDRADIMAHELGHLVGLRHAEENKRSIMFPSAASRIAWFEPRDIAALRRLYLGTT